MSRKLTRDQEIALVESAPARAAANVRRYLEVPVIRDTVRNKPSHTSFQTKTTRVRVTATCD